MNKVFQSVLLVLFIALNTILLYLFLLQLPYGVNAFVSSLTHWSELSPRIDTVATVALAIAVITFLLTQRLPASWKSGLLYFRRRFAHPGHRAFFGGKDPGFEREPLLKAYPEIHDSAYNPEVQMQVWKRLYQQNANAVLVASTAGSWRFLRNLYLVSLVFLSSFLVTWPLNLGVPIALAMMYLFIYGAQAIFLLFSARKTGERLANNVMATALGVK
ncbi:MAG: hypothetical protein ACR2P1_17840 [Pseudomonadales bacterium]